MVLFFTLVFYIFNICHSLRLASLCVVESETIIHAFGVVNMLKEFGGMQIFSNFGSKRVSLTLLSCFYLLKISRQ